MLSKKSPTVLGLSFSSEMLYYIELENRPEGAYPIVWGTLDITGLWHDGALDKEQARTLIGTLFEKSQARIIAYNSEDIPAQEEVWQELVRITQGIPYSHSRAEAFAQTSHAYAQTPQFMYFTGPKETVLYRAAQATAYTYPWSVDTIAVLQERVAKGGPLHLCGHFPVSAADILAAMRTYRLPACLADVWRACLDVARHAPPLHHKKSFAYMLAITNAVWAANLVVPKSPSHVVLSKPTFWKPRLPQLPIRIAESVPDSPTTASSGSLQKQMNIHESMHMSPEDESDS